MTCWDISEEKLNKISVWSNRRDNVFFAFYCAKYWKMNASTSFHQHTADVGKTRMLGRVLSHFAWHSLQGEDVHEICFFFWGGGVKKILTRNLKRTQNAWNANKVKVKKKFSAKKNWFFFPLKMCELPRNHVFRARFHGLGASSAMKNNCSPLWETTKGDWKFCLIGFIRNKTKFIPIWRKK